MQIIFFSPLFSLLPEIFRKSELSLEQRTITEDVYNAISLKLTAVYPEQVPFILYRQIKHIMALDVVDFNLYRFFILAGQTHYFGISQQIRRS